MAVIDMGSNSFRLVVFDYERGQRWHRTDEIREAVRVSEGLAAGGRLLPAPMDRARRTAGVFGAFCRASGIEDVVAVATSAIRDAENGTQLLAELQEALGFPVRIIDAKDEARYGYLAVANSTTIADGFGIDVGGGSVQVFELAGRALVRSDSWPLGAVRVSEGFLDGSRTSPKQIKALRRHVAATVRAPWFAAGSVARLAGIGGTVRNLASTAERRLGPLDLDVGGFVLTRDALGELVDELAALPVAKRASVPGIKPDRADVILGGAVVLDALMDQAGFDEIEVSEAGLREGIFFDRYLEDREPPLFPDVRRASVFNLAHLYQEDLAHPEHVAALALQLYDELGRAGLAPRDPADRELLWAACLLHDIGTAIHYDDHHKHSRYLILSAGLPGFPPREVALIAAIARWHRKGEPDPDELGPLARRGDARRLQLLCGIIRLAEQFERSRDGAVRELHLASANGVVRLQPVSARDASVAVWSARRTSGLLAEALGKRVEVADAA